MDWERPGRPEVQREFARRRNVMDRNKQTDTTAQALARRVLFSEETKQPARIEAREVPVEAPIAFAYGSLPYAVMMATPADLEDFTYGFSLTEGVIESPEHIRAIEIRRTEAGIAIDATLAAERMSKHLARKRAIAGGTGCGVCGVADLESLPRAQPVMREKARTIRPSAIGAALLALEQAQQLNLRTRAVHAAAFADEQGALALIREDVGRHNALDKLVGAIARATMEAAAGFGLITSRCSFEMVEKAATAGIRTLVAVSAPTSLAIERAKSHGMVLIAIARADYGLEFASGAGTLTP